MEGEIFRCRMKGFKIVPSKSTANDYTPSMTQVTIEVKTDPRIVKFLATLQCKDEQLEIALSTIPQAQTAMDFDPDPLRDMQDEGAFEGDPSDQPAEEEIAEEATEGEDAEGDTDSVEAWTR